MKKLLSKVRKKQPEQPAARITNDTLAEHRERVLAGGRKFKYPVQYQRHKLVINALIIGAAALILLVGIGWYLLYVTKNTSEFMYRVTKVVPVPVAVIDGQPVRYSEYLMKYRSAAHYLIEKAQIDTKGDDGKNQLAYVKEQAMNDAIADAFAAKKAKELDIKVTDADLEVFLKQQRQSIDGEFTEATYNAVIRDYYGWSPDEYRSAMKNKLLRQKVAYAVDAPAEALSQDVAKRVKAGETDLKKVAEALNKKQKDSAQYIPAAWVPRNNQDGGLAEAAGKLKKGQVSVAIKATTGTGYYFVKLLDSNEKQIQYEYIHIPLTEFGKQLAQAEKSGELKQFITIDDAQAQKK